MYDQFEGFPSISSTARGTEPDDRTFEPACPSLWATQIREALGEDGELDPQALEESWTSGLPLRLESFRVRQDDVAALGVGSGTFAGLNGFGGFCWTERANELAPCAPIPCDANVHTANWPHDPMENGSWQRAEQPDGDAAEPADCGASDDADRRPRVMTCQGARDLLGVSSQSSEAHLKAAYRRMVSAWHPDRLERSDEKVRAFATNQMAAINEAYHFLRGIAFVEAR